MHRKKHKKLSPAQRMKLRREIEHYESSINGLYMHSGMWASAKHIRVSGDIVTANIIIKDTVDHITHRYENCQYPLAMFKEV